MPIDKALYEAPATLIEIDQEDMPEIEIILDADGGATIEIGEDEDSEVDFYANLAEVVDDDTLSKIAIDLSAFFEADKSSRSDWEQTYAKGLELLGMNFQERTKPFRGAAAATHPLLMEAVVQFQAQATKELMPAGGPVRTEILGKETLDKFQQAGRVQDFMNYQITTVMKEYTPEFDQAMFYLGYGGSVFKKVYYDEQLGRMVSKLVLADDVFIPYYGSSVMSQCPRITHRIAMDSNEYRKRVVSGEYLDVVIEGELYPSDASQIRYQVDKQTGVVETGAPEEVFLLEFQVDYDLPGFEDKDDKGEPTGIKLPYVITLDEATKRVIGVRRNWEEDDERKKRRNYFVHYVLIEGLGSYGLGFVHLIGGLSKTATSALRQLLDAGTLSNLPAGFKAKGARIADQDNPIQPGEWRDIDVGGAELQQNMLPLPYKEPSQTLFALLGFCVDAGRRLASIADMQVGEGNQMAQVGTTLALLERGTQVMSAIHKRLHYALKEEFELLAKGFGMYMPDEYPYDVPGASRKIKKADFNNLVAVQPVSDPNIFSSAQRLTLAQMQLQMAQSAPQMHNLYEAYYRVYSAMNVRDIDSILKPQRTQMPKDPAQENGDVLDGMELKAFAGQQHDAHIAAHLMMGLSPMLQAQPIAAMTLQKHILDHVKLKAEETAEAELFAQYGSDPDQMVSELQHEALVALKVASFMQEVRDLQNQLMGVDQGPDPLIALKDKELQIRAQDDQASQQIDRAAERAKVARERADLMDRNARRQQNVQAMNQRRPQNAA
ncbi:hypothetical protein EBZ39_07335 [bacterium]|nr:hypothetical protein [bacterium]